LSVDGRQLTAVLFGWVERPIFCFRWKSSNFYCGWRKPSKEHFAKQKRSGLRDVKIAPDLQKTKISLDFFAYFIHQWKKVREAFGPAKKPTKEVHEYP
jgi:hypothetical protein